VSLLGDIRGRERIALGCFLCQLGVGFTYLFAAARGPCGPASCTRFSPAMASPWPRATSSTRFSWCFGARSMPRVYGTLMAVLALGGTAGSVFPQAVPTTRAAATRPSASTPR
jgi:hypothetical protein